MVLRCTVWCLSLSHHHCLHPHPVWLMPYLLLQHLLAQLGVKHHVTMSDLESGDWIPDDIYFNLPAPGGYIIWSFLCLLQWSCSGHADIYWQAMSHDMCVYISDIYRQQWWFMCQHDSALRWWAVSPIAVNIAVGISRFHPRFRSVSVLWNLGRARDNPTHVYAIIMEDHKEFMTGQRQHGRFIAPHYMDQRFLHGACI